jgi:hypothetical protein
MKAFTVKPPWAWAITYLGKDVENRQTNIVGSYRGLVAIHAGLVPDDAAYSQPGIILGAEFHRNRREAERPVKDARGAVVAVARIVGSHRVEDCADQRQNAPVAPNRCSLWADVVGARWHIELTDQQALDEPVPYRGHLGLWTLPDDEAYQVAVQL